MISKKLRTIMFDAYRRRDILKYKDIPITQQWLGLGSQSVYRPALEKGLMRWAIEEPPKRCQGWLCITENGLELLDELSPEFGKSLKEIKSGPNGVLYDYQLVTLVR